MSRPVVTNSVWLASENISLQKISLSLQDLDQGVTSLGTHERAFKITAVRLHVYLVFVKSIEQELKIQ